MQLAPFTNLLITIRFINKKNTFILTAFIKLSIKYNIVKAVFIYQTYNDTYNSYKHTNLNSIIDYSIFKLYNQKTVHNLVSIFLFVRMNQI